MMAQHLANIGFVHQGNFLQTAGYPSITFIQRRPNVFDVGPTLYKCYQNVLCLLE